MSSESSTPKTSECVKPTPGHPRWNLAGFSALTSKPNTPTPYTNHLVNRSGAYEPASRGMNAILRPRCFWKTYGSRSCAAQLMRRSSPEPLDDPGDADHEPAQERQALEERVQVVLVVDAERGVGDPGGEVERKRAHRSRDPTRLRRFRAPGNTAER